MMNFNLPLVSGLSDASLGTKVCAFFLRNPNEELDVDAISVKFGVPRGRIHSELALYVQEKLLLRSEGHEYGYTYWRGPELSHQNIEVMNA